MTLWKAVRIFLVVIFILIIGLTVFVLYRLFGPPERFKPVVDPALFMSITVDRPIDTLSLLPHDNLKAMNGINDMKEILEFYASGTQVIMYLFETDTAALSNYRSKRSYERLAIFDEGGAGNDQYYITYAIQARSCPAGFMMPLSYSYCYAVFLKSNVVIVFRGHLKSRDDRSLVEAIDYVGDLLKDIVGNS